jgi:hypothetical protein
MSSKSDSEDARERRSPQIGIKVLKHRFGAVAAQTVDSFTLPRFPPRLVLKRLGISASTLANWLTAKTFNLDADKSREGKGAHRLFSARDAVLLSAAAQVAAIGAPLAVNKFVAEIVAAEIVSSIGGSQLHIPCLELILFRRTNAWWVISRVSVNASKGAKLPPREIAAKVFAGGKSKDVAINDLPDAPPLHIVFDLISFSRQVLGELGIMVMSGDISRERPEANANQECRD